MLRNFSKTEIAKLNKKFKKNNPFPHLVVENLLIAHTKLHEAITTEKFYKKDNDLFSLNQTSNLVYSKNKIIIDSVKMFSSKEFAELISKITNIKLKPGAVDLFGALYEKTDYLLCHDDELEGRKVAFVLYLSPSFETKDGGSLILLSSKDKKPGKAVVAYPPLENSLAIFEVSRKSWHEVGEVLTNKKRYTIGGWLH